MDKLKSPSKRWGIVVGVDKYVNANEFLHNLQGCVVDAHKIYDTMMNKDCCGFLEDHARLLENPCLDDLEVAFADVGSRMCAGDELWFYFAGHGYSDKNRKRDNGYLLLSGAKYDKQTGLHSEGSMSRDQLWDLVDKHIKVGVTVVFFLDCCCAASVGLNTGDRAVQEAAELEDIATSFSSMRPRDLNHVSPDEETEPLQFMSLCATGKYGRAHEDENGGAFTKRLIEGLMGGTSAHPTAFEDACVTASALGNYVGAKMTSQGPKQSFTDPMYPLSFSPKKKQELMQKDERNRMAKKWLVNCGADTTDSVFAAAVLEGKESFEFGGAMCAVLRLVGDPNCTLKLEGDDAANLLKAFHVLKNLLDRSGEVEPKTQTTSVLQGVGNKKLAGKPMPADFRMGQVPLTGEDKKLLADVAEHLRNMDGEAAALSILGRKSQVDAVMALDAMARKRMRRLCAPLFEKNDRAAWDLKSRDGFSSIVEAAVYEIVKDDEALASLKK